jgi:hypothetical protein
VLLALAVAPEAGGICTPLGSAEVNVAGDVEAVSVVLALNDCDGLTVAAALGAALSLAPG